MTTPASFLVVAHSARLLAQSAARGGHPVRVLDLFNDTDTGRFAQRAEAVNARAGEAPGFDRQDLLRRAARLCPPAHCLGLVYGAGFEDDTMTLGLLARGRVLLGNRPEVIARLKDPATFFALLDRLAIAHPETVLSTPVDRRGWLYKRRGATGGSHVINAQSLERIPAAGEGYFQRRVPGRNLSMLFLADGRRLDVIGISEQLTLRRQPHRYAYAGAVGPACVPSTVSRTLRDRIEALVAETGLVGCNSVDFLLDRNRPAVLEINPRPSATMDLYDADWPAGLFDAHLRACAGELPRRASRGARRVRAHAIVYASAPIRIARDPGFPAWCSDLPRAGSAVAIDAPVCTVHAEGADPAGARRQLVRRRRQIEVKLAEQRHSEETEHGFKPSAPEREPRSRSTGHIAA
jgi:predicted ATP-grasp superfamily ATP-dependent carboligase